MQTILNPLKDKPFQTNISIDYIIDDKSQSWPTKSDDFFPYATDPHTFFTGYFSSRYVWMKSIFDIPSQYTLNLKIHNLRY